MHNGHLHHLELCRKATGADGIVAVMSGNFVQRGTPAIIDKWTRTRHALENGVDLVLELPVLYSLSSAEFFASGAVGILDSLGIISSLCFGSEYTEVEKMLEISSFLLQEPKEYKEALKMHLDSGVGFPTARSLSLEGSLKELTGYLGASNSILGTAKVCLGSKAALNPSLYNVSGVFTLIPNFAGNSQARHPSEITSGTTEAWMPLNLRSRRMYSLRFSSLNCMDMIFQKAAQCFPI